MHACQALPGGYKVGEKVFYTGQSFIWSYFSIEYDGKTLDRVYGEQGEVTGPATTEYTKGKGVKVLFPGNTASINCLLTTVRRLRAASAATHTPQPAAPHTRRCPRPVRPLDNLCRGAPALTA